MNNENTNPENKRKLLHPSEDVENKRLKTEQDLCDNDQVGVNNFFLSVCVCVLNYGQRNGVVNKVSILPKAFRCLNWYTNCLGQTFGK